MARPTRREVLAAAAAALLVRRPQPAPVPQSFDGLGEIRPSYPPALLDEIRASGLRAALVTVGNPALHGPEALADLEREVAGYDRFVAGDPERLLAIRAPSDLARAEASGRIGLAYYSQNATPLEHDAGRLDHLHRLGVRVIQLTYNARNLLGDGCLERTDAGLSHFGLEVLAGMNARRMLACVAHSGEATTLDAIRHSTAPVAITHAGCRAVFDHPRNKSDRVLRALADQGGVIGIYQINPYLGPRERNTLEDYLAHLGHAIRVAGVEHVGVGSDREYQAIPDTPEERERLRAELGRLGPNRGAGFRWPFFLSELNHPRRMETIARALRGRGLGSRDIERILWGNFRRLVGETVG